MRRLFHEEERELDQLYLIPIRGYSSDDPTILADAVLSDEFFARLPPNMVSSYIQGA